MFENIDLSR